MILGRPTNLWLGLVTAAIATLQVILIQAGFDPVATATILGSIGGLAGIVIALIANQPPTMNVGQNYTVVTPEGQPNVEKVANANLTPPPAIQVPKT